MGYPTRGTFRVKVGTERYSEREREKLGDVGLFGEEQHGHTLVGQVWKELDGVDKLLEVRK